MLTETQRHDFKKSLICTLSLSSKELFHSNMIGWLLENHIDFAKLLLKMPDLKMIEKVEREKFNFDLLVLADGDLYVIENKVKSLPDVEQIKKYQETIKKKKETATFILISLIPPGEDFLDDLKDVSVVSYDDILKFLSEINLANRYHEAMIEDYRLLISTLLTIKNNSEISNESAPHAFCPVDEDVLRELRLFDVAQKIRASCFARMLDKALIGLNLPEYDLLKQKTEVSLSNSIGLVSIKFGFQNISKNVDLLLGIQIQGNQYRLFVESTNGADVQKIAKSLKEEKLWLNPSDEYRGRTEILKFGRIFKYSYSSIKGFKIGDLINLVKADVSRLFNNMMALEDRCQITKRTINTVPSMNEHPGWSASLLSQTREAISGIQVSPHDGNLHFKSHDYGGAVMTIDDLLAGRMRLIDKNGGTVTEFSDVEQLIDAGWAID